MSSTFSPEHPSLHGTSTFSGRLADGDPEAIMELYDHIAPRAYALALHFTGSRICACAAVREAFLHAIEQPSIFADGTLSGPERILLEVNHYALRERRRGRLSLLSRSSCDDIADSVVTA